MQLLKHSTTIKFCDVNANKKVSLPHTIKASAFVSFGRDVKIFLSSSLITGQNLAAVFHTVWGACRRSQNSRVLERHSLEIETVPDPIVPAK